MRAGAILSRAANSALAAGRPATSAGPRLVQIALAVMLTLIWFAWLGWQALEVYIGREVHVPVLVGATLAEAQTAARRVGLTLDPVERAHHPRVPAGVVAAQDQAPLKRVKHGRQIGVTVSLGPRMVTVPNIAQRNVREARVLLENAELRSTIVHEAYEEALTAGTISRQDPPAGSVVTADTPIMLVVDPGPASETMPHVIGKQLGEAYWLLKGRGLAISFIHTRAGKNMEPGTVMAQRPAGGTHMRRRAAPITLIISRPALAGEFSRVPRPRKEPGVPR